GVHTTSGAESSSRGVVQLSSCQSRAGSPRNQHRSILQQSRRVKVAAGAHASGSGESSSRGVVQLSASQRAAERALSPRNQDFSAVQQCCLVKTAGGVQAACRYKRALLCIHNTRKKRQAST